MRAVAGSAVALRPRVLHFRAFDLLGLRIVTGNAQSASIGLGQDNFSILSVAMAGVARPGLEGRMLESLRQLRLEGLMCIVAGKAIRGSEGLIVMSLGQLLVLGVMTVEAESGHVLGQMVGVLSLVGDARLMRHVAGIATHVECRVAAAVGRDIQTLDVASKTEVVIPITARRFFQLVLDGRNVRVMAAEAVSRNREMRPGVARAGFHAFMARKTNRLRSCFGQLDPRNVWSLLVPALDNADFVA